MTHYVFLTYQEILGVFEFSSEEKMKEYANSYPAVLCGKIEPEIVEMIRNQIRGELRADVEKLINKLWGHIPEISKDDEEKKENGPANS